MVIKGKCRGNGNQLASYLLSDKNDKAEILEITGTTAPNDLNRSLVEMALSAISTKSQAGLYHAQINPDPREPGMTKEAWLKSVDILAKELGLEGQRRAIVLHEKDGRTHAHVVFERYQEGRGKNQQGILWDDKGNYEKHYKASRAIEQVLGHERTPEKSDVKQTQNKRNLDVKKELTELWNKHTDPQKFIKEAEKLGYTVAQGEDRRPYKVITSDGKSLDLTRQLEKIITKDVTERLNPIRKSLKTEKEALAEAQTRQQVKEQPKKEQAPPLALKWDLGTVQKTEAPQPQKPANDNNIHEKTENLHKLGQFKANEPAKPAESIKAVETKPANDNSRQRKIDEMRANEAEMRKEVERRSKLTQEQKKAEDKVRFEEKIKQMREQEHSFSRENRL